MTSLMRIVLVSSALILPLGGCASVGDALDPSDWFSGDMFSGTGGRFHVFVSEEPNREAFLASLPQLLDLPIERVLIAHQRASCLERRIEPFVRIDRH